MLNFRWILMLFLLNAGISVAQKGSATINRVIPVISKCEIETLKNQEKISNFAFNQKDSIQNILKFWSTQCGNIEPIQRIKLLLDIQQKKLIIAHYRKYIIKNISKYQDRIFNSIAADCDQKYSSNKAYFDFLPLNCNLDIWTKDFAEELLHYQEKGSSEYLFCLLFVNNFEQFNRQLNSKLYQQNYIYLKTTRHKKNKD